MIKGYACALKPAKLTKPSFTFLSLSTILPTESCITDLCLSAVKKHPG